MMECVDATFHHASPKEREPVAGTDCVFTLIYALSPHYKNAPHSSTEPRFLPYPELLILSSMSPETKKDIIKKLVEEVEVNAISPHLYTLHITWIRPMASMRDDVALLGRSDPTRDKMIACWSEEEDEAVRMLYPERPQIELLQTIPHKTAAQIKNRAWQLGVKRDYRHIDEQQRFYWTVSYSAISV